MGTHGHPTGYLAAGAFAVIVRALAEGATLTDGVADALGLLRAWPGHEETTAALTAARDAAASGPPSPETLERIGAGWVAEEALAIGVYAALARPEPERVRDALLLLAVNHSGDSDSTGSAPTPAHWPACKRPTRPMISRSRSSAAEGG